MGDRVGDVVGDEVGCDGVDGDGVGDVRGWEM